MKTFILLTIVQLTSLFSYGFVMPLDLILKKNTAQSGNQIFSVEQDVTFKDAAYEFTIRETWLVEGDKNLKVTAVGLGELKDLFKFTAVYNNKTRTLMYGKNKVSEPLGKDFYERYLSVRSVDSYKAYLNDLGIAPNVRISRAGGTIAYAIGEQSPAGSLKPQFWIDQETFNIKKIRTPSESEISFSDYAEYGSLSYPKSKTIEWAGKKVLIKVRSVNTKTNASLSNFYPQNLDQPSEVQIANKGAMTMIIEEFYKRFR